MRKFIYALLSIYSTTMCFATEGAEIVGWDYLQPKYPKFRADMNDVNSVAIEVMIDRGSFLDAGHRAAFRSRYRDATASAESEVANGYDQFKVKGLGRITDIFSEYGMVNIDSGPGGKPPFKNLSSLLLGDIFLRSDSVNTFMGAATSFFVPTFIVIEPVAYKEARESYYQSYPILVQVSLNLNDLPRDVAIGYFRQFYNSLPRNVARQLRSYFRQMEARRLLASK